MTMARRALVFALLLVFSAIGPAFAQDLIVGVASVIDGDTIEIHGQRIRLFGIDAPESSQLCVRPTGERWYCGQRASFALADRIGRATVSCQPRDFDRYGRVVAVCFKGNEDLNRWMVASGWAAALQTIFIGLRGGRGWRTSQSDQYLVRRIRDAVGLAAAAPPQVKQRPEMKPEPATLNEEVLAGLVERVTYHNVENGFCVLRAKARGHRDVVTVVGHAAAIAAGEWITASGQWVNDRTHGQQFKARFLRTSPPTSAEGIEKYLSSGMIRGVGPVYARSSSEPSVRRCSTLSRGLRNG